MRIILFLLLFLTSNLVSAQGTKIISGKIVVADATVDQVLVVNLNTEKETRTDKDGHFKIEAHLDDLLIFQAPHLDKMRKLIDEDAYDSPLVTIEMTSHVTELDEVVVTNYSHINAFNLGITSTYIKPLTPAERGKYRSETRAKEFSEKLLMIEKLETLYDEDFLTTKLKIEKDLIKAFFFYAVEHPWFIAVLKGKNKTLQTFYLTILAKRYNDLQKQP